MCVCVFTLTQDIHLHSPNVQWDDIIGLEDAKRLVKEAVVYPIKVLLHHLMLVCVCSHTPSASCEFTLLAEQTQIITTCENKTRLQLMFDGHTSTFTLTSSGGCEIMSVIVTHTLLHPLLTLSPTVSFTFANLEKQIQAPADDHIFTERSSKQSLSSGQSSRIKTKI